MFFCDVVQAPTSLATAAARGTKRSEASSAEPSTRASTAESAPVAPVKKKGKFSSCYLCNASPKGTKEGC